MTIRDNILFDQPLKEDHYVRTVLSCQLESDFELLKSGDLSEIGEKGINLSGGQKARVSLARAVYANKDIILMDDPISALDAHVRKAIFHRVFKSMLGNRTRILVTHAIDFVHLADRVVVMKEGSIAVQGTYDEVKKNPIVEEIINIHQKNKKEQDDKKTKEPKEEEKDEAEDLFEAEIEANEVAEPEPLLMMKKKTTYSEMTSEYIKAKLLKISRGKSEQDGKMMKDDDDEKEELESGILMKAVKNIGGIAFWVLMFSAYIAMSLWNKYRDFKLKNMSSEQSAAKAQGVEMDLTKNLGSTLFDIIAPMLLDMACDFAKLFVGAKFSQKMFTIILNKILNAPVNLYFDITPMSKIKGYLTSDIDRCDSHFWGCFEWVSHTVIDAATKIIIASYFSPLLGFIILCTAYILRLYKEHTSNARDEVGRVRGKMHTQMKTHLDQSTNGMSVVRAFQRQETCIAKTTKLIHQDKASDMVGRGASEYFQTRLQWLNNVLYIVVGVICVRLRNTGTVEPIWIAMMFQYLQGISHSLNRLTHGYREIENNLKSLQKVLKLEDVAQEKARTGEDEAAFPVLEQGGQKIRFRDVEMKYRPDTDMVLNKLDFEI